MSGAEPQGPMDIWRALDHARALLTQGAAGRAEAQAELARQAARLETLAALEPDLAAGRRAALEGFCATWRLAPVPAPACVDGRRLPPAPDPEGPGQDRVGQNHAGQDRVVQDGVVQDGADTGGADPALDDPGFDPSALKTWVREVRPGVSLVTCCKNRNDNLMRALPSWLAEPGISQIVIVDWSSDVPVAQSLAAAGISDPRILLARVEDEPRWILSYAFNVGFRLAAHAVILKVDADIVLAPGYLAANPLGPGQFIAGNWRAARRGQEFVNGFFQVARADLMAVKGFNEYITSYGWDDDDLYGRLMAQGLARVDVTPGTVRHLDHDDAARLEGSRGPVSAWAELQHMPMFKTRTNRFLATMMPGWDGWRVMLPYRVAELAPGDLMLRRSEPPRHRVPDHLRAIAERLAAYELLSWRASLRVFDLTPEALELLLRRRHLGDIGAVQVDLMLAGADMAVVTAPRLLIADLDAGAVLSGPAALVALTEGLETRAAAAGRALVLRVPPEHLPRAQEAGLTPPLLPAHPHLSPVRDMDLEAIATDPHTPSLRVEVTGDRAANPTGPLAAPATGRKRDRVFIDAQHGLGNRLRAIGSAAAIARATGRELVVVWQPDHHCEGRMADLFDYDGAVEEESFLPRARATGATVLNYMEIEEGATKDAPLVLVPGRDAYLRSAFVINHPASSWDSENLLLGALRPSAPVRDLIAGARDHRDIGLHVRMEGATGTEIKSYDSAENWSRASHDAITEWRDKSHYGRFLKRLDALLLEEPDAKVFLAADLPETYRVFAGTYGDRVAWLERAVYDRSAAQLHYALADILLLARCATFLGSNWSSFSEMALRMSRSVRHHEMSGIDF